MACNQTKPKGRKRKLLPSDYTEFGDPHSAKIQQSRDKLDFSGTSDIEKDSFGEFSDLNGQKNRTNLLDVSSFHGDLLPLSQAGKFIPKFQTKVIRKIKTNHTIASENVRKKGSFLNNVCMENKSSTETESLDCNFQHCLETQSMNDSKDNSEPDNLLFNEESKQAADSTSHTIAAVEIAAPLKKKLNLTKNYGHDELDTGTSEHLTKKKGKGKLQRMSERTLGIRKAKSTGVVHMNTENNSGSTDDVEAENMTTVNSLESGVVSEMLKLEIHLSADGVSQNKSFKNSENSNLYPDNMSDIAEIEENLDWKNSSIEAFDQKLIAADAVVEIERLELSQKESYGSTFPQVELHSALDEIKNDYSMTNLNQSELSVKSASTGQHHELDVSKVTASTEFDSKFVNNSQPFLSNSRHMNSKTDNSCSKISQKTGDQLTASVPATSTTTYDLKPSHSEKISQHSIETEETSSSNCKAKETLQNETELTTPKCTESAAWLDAELDHMIKLTEKCNAEEVESCGENKFIAELGSSVGKRAEMTTQLQSQSFSDVLLQKSADLGQENYLNQQAVQSVHQELCSTFDDFPDVTDSQMYLLDEESVTKPTIFSSTNLPMPSTGISCPGLANLSKALDTLKSVDSVHVSEVKRREGNKILQNLIKELTSVNAQLIRYRRQIEKAKKERMEHLRSTSCARQY